MLTWLRKRRAWREWIAAETAEYMDWHGRAAYGNSRERLNEAMRLGDRDEVRLWRAIRANIARIEGRW